ncbi:phosphonate ABC transporter, permease protein PhnE, partial [Mycobacterium tuberculosis]|nr:phosphonate ABC transporter, permease protein PhnE [Mycobacterium tuberculosis]
TVLIAYVGTLTGALFAFAAAFLAARNFNALAPARFVVRRALEIARTVPDLVFALVFVAAFGLGPLPGVLALAIHSAGALGKLFSE